MPSSAARAAATPCTTSARSTAPTSTASGSTPRRCPAATRCRSASSGSSTSPPPSAPGGGARRVTAVRLPRESRHRAAATLTIGDVLAQLQRRLPRPHDQQDPLPRDRGPGRSPSARRRATASSPPADVARLRYVLAQQRDHYLPLRVIKEQLDAIDRGLVPPGAGRRCPRVAARRRRRDRGQRADRRALPAGAGRAAAVARGAAQRGRPARRAAARARAVRPDRRQARRPLRRRRAGRRQDRRRPGPLRARGPAPARVPHRRRARGRAVLPGRRPDVAPARRRGQGPRRGDRPRARRAVGAPARRARPDRPARGHRRLAEPAPSRSSPSV